MNSKRLAFLIGLSILICIGAIFYVFGERPVTKPIVTAEPADSEPAPKSKNKRVEPEPLEFRNTALSVGYVGDAKCAECHLAETESYRKHPMGRSMTTVGKLKPASTKEPFTVDGYRYSVRTEGDRVIHVEEKLDVSGKVVSTKEEDVSLVVGSGTRGHAFLVERKGAQFQSPVSWYSSVGKYDLAPGYAGKNLHFDRQIHQGCLHCHADRVDEKPDGALAINGLTIGCERCHGPGEIHAKEQKTVGGYDPTIVNPVKLTPTRRDQVCYQCHLQLDAREEIEGKKVVDYRPGGDLYEFVRRSEIPLSDPYLQMKSLGHAHQMESSKCFVNSDGKMGCVTCHNPHEWPAKLEDRIALHNRKCASCHDAGNECSMPTPARLLKSPGDDCVSCHMPTRQTSDIGHTALTDHRISRKAEQAAQPSPHVKP